VVLVYQRLAEYVVVAVAGAEQLRSLQAPWGDLAGDLAQAEVHVFLMYTHAEYLAQAVGPL